ncbi:MAG: nuclease [Actinomycetospora chiangmaiensis]|nr:nuclease [Actinomycetospora chiangmaiensis]
MTSSTEVAEQEARPEHPQLDGPDRTALLAALRTEIEKARPFPVAERTVTLIAQAALEPQDAPPGYRVIDRHGAPRLHAAPEGGEGRPFTISDLLAELREKHPGLFRPPEPVPQGPPAPETRDSALTTGASEMRAATARFLGTQSERARTLAEQSTVQGRALAQSAAGALTTLRGRLRREPPPAPVVGAANAPVTAGEAPAEPPVGRFAAPRDSSGDPETSDHRRRVWLIGGAAATAAMLLLAVLVNRSDSPQTASSPPAPAPKPGPTATAEAPPSSRAPAPAPDNVTPPPEGDGRGEPDTDATPPAPNAITGTVQVIDTATLKLNGKLVHLFGVEWVRGGQAEELTRYIAGRPVTCQPAPGSESMNCSIDGRDLSEVILYNGGGRASPEASPELVAAEDHARSERLGVWKR